MRVCQTCPRIERLEILFFFMFNDNYRPSTIVQYVFDSFNLHLSATGPQGAGPLIPDCKEELITSALVLVFALRIIWKICTPPSKTLSLQVHERREFHLRNLLKCMFRPKLTWTK